MTGELGKHGTTYKYVPETDNMIVYLRDRSTGARIFLEKINNDEYNLIGICKGTQKKKDEDRMIKRIIKNYADKN